MSWWEYLILFGSVLAGGLPAFFLQQNRPQILGLILTFSGAYLLGISVFHLLPAVYAGHPPATIGIWVLLGFLIQLMLERLSRGLEHGHLHSPGRPTGAVAMQIMIGLSVHSLIEGFPLGHYDTLHHLHEATDHQHQHNHLLYGIALHKAPAAFTLVSLFCLSGYSRLVTLGCLLLFAGITPLGAWLATQVAPNEAVLQRLVALVAGNFLHIATTILFEADDKHHQTISWTKIGFALLGMGLTLLTIH